MKRKKTSIITFIPFPAVSIRNIFGRRATAMRILTTSDTFPIRDVVNPYGINHLVKIADDPETFIEAAESIFSSRNQAKWLNDVDEFLYNNSWDRTWMQMMQLLQTAVKQKPNINTRKNKEAYV